jgi:hypothetical protein
MRWPTGASDTMTASSVRVLTSLQVYSIRVQSFYKIGEANQNIVGGFDLAAVP